MAVAVQASTTRSSATANATGDRPTGTVDGDLLIAFVLIATGTTVSGVPSGWNLEDNTGNAAGCRVVTYTKIASSEPATWTWTLNTATNNAVHVLRIDGHDPTTYVNVDGGQANDSASTSVVAPSVTTTKDNCLLIFAGGINANATQTAPGSMTEVTDALGGGSARALETAQQALGAAGATGTRTSTASASAVNVGYLIAIAPPPAASSASLLMAFP